MENQYEGCNVAYDSLTHVNDMSSRPRDFCCQTGCCDCPFGFKKEL